MAATLYDRLNAVNSEYVPQFVGSEYQQLRDTAAALDARYRENKNYSDKIAMTLAQEQYLDADKDIKDRLAKNIYGQIDKIASSEKDFENSSGAVSQLARDFFTNQDRIAALDNYKRVEQAKEMQNKLGAAALNFGDDPRNFSTVDPVTGERRRFNNAIEERGDYSGRMQQLLGRVADDGYTVSPTGQKITFDDTERYLIKSGQVNHLTKDKLNALVEGLLPVYKNTSEGIQDIRRLTQLEGYRNEPIMVSNGKITRQTTDVDEDIRDRFRALAAPQAFSKSALRWDDFGLGRGKGAGEEDTSGLYTPTIPGGVTDNTSLQALPDPNESFNVSSMMKLSNGDIGYLVDKNGNKVPLSSVKPSGAELPNNPEELKKFVADLNKDPYYGGKNYQLVTVNKAAVEAKQNENYNNLTAQLPAIANYYGSPEEYKKSYSEAVKAHKKITPTGNVIAPEQAKLYDDLVNRSAAVSAIHYKEGGKKPTSLDELASELDTTPQNIEFKTISTYHESPSSTLPGGYVEAKVIVHDKDAKTPPSTVFIPLNDQFTALSKPIDDVYKNSFYKGQDTFTPNNPYPTGLKSPDGGELYVYTITYPKKSSEQREGQPKFNTFVFEGKAVPNATGGITINWNDNPTNISDWRGKMIERQAPLLKNALNSGQTFTGKDVKERGLEF